MGESIICNWMIRSRKSPELAFLFGGTFHEWLLVVLHLPINAAKDTPMFGKCPNHSTRVTYENKFGNCGPWGMRDFGSLKQTYIECFGVHSANVTTWREAVTALMDRGCTREMLVEWGVDAGYGRKY